MVVVRMSDAPAMRLAGANIEIDSKSNEPRLNQAIVPAAPDPQMFPEY
jgi:hypothetical protein